MEEVTQTHIVDLPLEVWSTVLGHFTACDAVDVFDALYDAGALGTITSRLDTFWIVMDAAKRKRGEKEEEEEFPDPEPFRMGVKKLVDMGVDKEKAMTMMRLSNGVWEETMRQLGWS